jgi:hypothetical protein
MGREPRNHLLLGQDRRDPVEIEQVMMKQDDQKHGQKSQEIEPMEPFR